MNFDQQAEALFESKGDLTEADTLALLMGGSGAGDTAQSGSEGGSAAPGAGAGADTGMPDAGATAGTQGAEGSGNAQTSGANDGGTGGGAAAPAPAPSPAPAPAADGGEPANAVVLAKDGIHTIPYEKLTSAREAARVASERAAAAEAEAQRLRDELAQARMTPAPAAAPAAAAGTEGTPAAGNLDPESLFGDYSGQSMLNGVQAIVDAALAKQAAAIDAKLAPSEAQRIQDANKVHFTTIYTAHKDADSIVESAEFDSWLKTQPKLIQGTYSHALKDGSAADVVEVLDAYRAAHPAQAPAAAPAPAVPAATGASAAALAQAAIANVQPKTPTSLTDIPAGASPHVNETEAMANMNELDLLNRMTGMTPDKIESLLTRAL